MVKDSSFKLIAMVSRKIILEKRISKYQAIIEDINEYIKNYLTSTKDIKDFETIFNKAKSDHKNKLIDTSDEEELERAFQNALGRSFRSSQPQLRVSEVIPKKSQDRINNMKGGNATDDFFIPEYILVSREIPDVYEDMLEDGRCLDFFHENGMKKSEAVIDNILRNWNNPIYSI